MLDSLFLDKVYRNYHRKKTDRNNLSFFYGAAEASLLEPFDSISDWLLSSPDIDWVMQLREASRTKFVQQYQL